MKRKTIKVEKQILIGITISALALATITGVMNFSFSASAAGNDTTTVEYGETLAEQTPDSITSKTWAWTPSGKTGWNWVDSTSDFFGNAGSQTFIVKKGSGSTTAYNAITTTVKPRVVSPTVRYGNFGSTAPTSWAGNSNKARTTDSTYKMTITGSSNSSTMGTVTGGGTYWKGQSVTLTATPKSGYKLEQWNTGSTSLSITVTPYSNMTYTATFVKDVYTIPSYGGDWKYIDLYTGETRVTESLEAPRRAGYIATGFNTSDPSNVRVYWEETDNALLSMESGEVKNMTIKELYDGYKKMYSKGCLCTASRYGERIGAWVVLANGGRTLGGQNVHPVNNSGVTVSNTDINKVKNGENLGTRRESYDQNDTCVFGGSLESVYYTTGYGYGFYWVKDSNGEEGSSSRSWAYQDYSGNTRDTYVDENTIVTVICR